MTEEEASACAAEHNRRRQLYPEVGRWNGIAFDGGWMMTPDDAETDGRIGYTYLVVLSDGRVYEEGSTLPPEWTVARYAARHGRLMPPEEAARDRAVELLSGRDVSGDARWFGIRFAGGWLMRLVLDVERPATDLAWIVALDDGRVVEEEVAGRLDQIVKRHETTDHL